MRVKLCGEVVDNNSAELYRDFGFTVCCPGDVRDALNTCPDEEPLILEINSGGGSAYAGFEIYSLLRARKGKTVAEIQSIAASAMSVVAAACDSVLMSPVAEIMIHRASVLAQGNSRIMKQAAQMLDTIDESILTAYVEKAGEKADREKFARMMRNETFLTAQQAIECGLADGFLNAPEKDTPMEFPPGLAFASLPGTLPDFLRITCRGRLPPVDDLKKIIEERKETDTMTPSPEPLPTAMDQHEPATPEELVSRFPELTKTLMQQAAIQAAETERNRIAEIDAAALPGFEDLTAKAKADPNATAASLALEIIREQKQRGTAYLKSRDSDVKNSNVNTVPAATPPDSDTDPADNAGMAAKEAVSLWESMRKGSEP